MNTIFALSTPWGKSGVAIIRISGKDAKKALCYFRITKAIKPRVATFSKLYDSQNEFIDEALVLYFSKPNSFTGEDLIEFHIHGSIAIINILMKELGKIFTLASPGEFSLRAFLNNKLDLTKAEGIADLINSETEVQAKQALRQLSGEVKNLYQNWRQQIIDIYSNIEAYIDFPEEVTASALQNINNTLECLKDSIAAHLNDDHKGERLRQGICVAIVGEPNVGKSTLFNHLAKRDIAIVSEHAGTTRDSLEVHIDIGGYPFIIIDTAGIRVSDNPIEKEGIKRAKLKAESADFKIALFSHDNINEKNLYNNDIMRLTNENTIYALSKADNISKDFTIINNINFLLISVHNNKGIDKLLNIMKKKAKETFTFKDYPFITSERHRQHLQNALLSLQQININMPIELIAEELRVAIKELGKITGVITTDNILDSIFSKFCLGK